MIEARWFDCPNCGGSELVPKKLITIIRGVSCRSCGKEIQVSATDDPFLEEQPRTSAKVGK